MESEIDEITDRLSDLPEFILHRILSYLPRKYAAKTSVLSKRWNSVWLSFPIFEFRDFNYIQRNRGMPGFFEALEPFLTFVDKSLQCFSQKNLRMEALHLHTSVHCRDLVPMIDRWIPLALHCGVSRINFMVASFDSDFLYYPLPETTFLINEPVSGFSTFYHLQTLQLYMVRLSENIIRAIIQNCPNLTNLGLSLFQGLKALEISKLRRLERLDINTGLDFEIESVAVNATSLKYFSFVSYRSEAPCVIGLSSSQGLVRLSVSGCAITDSVLNSYLSGFPLLERLKLSNCRMLRRIRISSPQLKLLALSCSGLEVVRIHTPNLSKFEYTTFESMPKFLAESVILCSLKIYVKLHDKSRHINTFWFLKLREFLGSISARALVFSIFVGDKMVSFDPEALRCFATPPPVEVDLLEIHCTNMRQRLDCPAIGEGLLWSCCPKSVSVFH